MKNLFLLLSLLLSISFTSLEAQNPQDNTWYRIESGQNKKNISNNSSTTTSSVIVSKNSVTQEGHWMFERIFDNTKVKKYRLKNRFSGMYMANFLQTNEGSQIKQTKSPGAGAVWRLEELQGGYFTIISNASNMYLGLSGQEEGATLMQTSKRTNTTTWKLTPVGFGDDSPTSKGKETTATNTNTTNINTAKYFEFVSDMNARSLANNGKKENNSVLIAKQKVQQGGHWKFISAGNGTYHIQNKYSGLYLTNRSSKSSGAAIYQTSSKDAGTLWKLEKIGGNKYYIVNTHSGMYLGTSGTHSGATSTQKSSKDNTTTWTLKEL